MFSWWRRRKLAKMVEQDNQDFHKRRWLEKVLSVDELDCFRIAQRVSFFYCLLIEEKEPKRDRSDEIKRLMKNYRTEMKRIIDEERVEKAERRDQQIVDLIHDAQFDKDYQYTSPLYLFFRRSSYEERLRWKNEMDQLASVFFPFMEDE